jgi:membrane protease YdiL (CAAX protease family)
MSAIQTTSQPVGSQSTAGVSSWIRRHPLLTLFALVYLFEWIILIPLALSSQGLFPQVPAILGLAGGWGPALAAIIVTGITEGRKGVRTLFARFLIWRVGIQWYIIALFGLAAAILGGIGLSVLFGGARPLIPAMGFPLPTVVFAFVVTLLFGAVFNTEEIAWRGVALPRLQATHSALVASLILAVPEGLSHLPNFFNKSIAFYQTVGLVAFMLFSIAMTIVYTWVFNNTRGSLLVVTLLHASQNAWANLLSDNSARPFYFTVGLLALVAIILVIAFGPARLGRTPVSPLKGVPDAPASPR